MNLPFLLIAGLILLSGAFVAFRPKPIESALWLILNFFLTSVLYVLIGAHLAAVVQILVYAGAIMVLFTFVILLLNLDPKELGGDAPLPWTGFVMFVGTIAAVFLCLHIASPVLLEPMRDVSLQPNFGTIEAFSRELLTNYAWSFEVAGVLLLMAVIGVGLLAYRERKPAATEEAS